MNTNFAETNPVTPINQNPEALANLVNTIHSHSDILSQREREVLKYRFEDIMTLEEIAKIYNVTRERIRQIEAKAMRKLRDLE